MKTEVQIPNETLEELRESEARFRAVFEQAAVGVAQVDSRTGRFIRINQRYCDIVGYSREEMETLDFQAITHPDDLPANMESMRQLAEGRIHEFSLHKRYFRKDGQPVWVNMTVSPMWRPGEPPGFHIAVVENITARKRAEEELKQRAEELAVLNALGRNVNAAFSPEEAATAGLKSIHEAIHPDMAFLFLRQGERLVLQDILPPEAVQRLSGMPEHKVGECVCGLAVTENRPLFAADIFTDPRCTWEECKRAGVRSFAALPLRSGAETLGVIGLASETPRDFRPRAEFLETLADQVAASLTNARLFEAIRKELAERRRAEEGLRESEERFRLTFQTSPDAININRLDDGMFVDVNEGFTRLTGYAREDVIGKTSLEVDIWHDPADRQELVGGLREKGYYSDLEARFRLKDGSVNVGLMSARVLPLGGVPHIISITRDITERKRMEQERDKLSEQLLQSQKMEAVGRLAGGVAHDFNNMLQTILGYSDLALTKIGPEDNLCEYLREIRKAAERSADLTRQLLAFARKQTVSPRVLDMNEAVGGMLKMLRRLIGEDIELIWKPGPELWPVKVDPAQVDQILANLSVNARDAISGVGMLTIETDNATLDETYGENKAGFIPGQYVLLAVSDNGCGMDKEVLGHLFEPFFTTKEVGRGTGLGLATVYGIVKQNSGLINVYSEPGRGTTFRVYLPRAEEAAEIKAAAVEQKPATGSETVLLVEDDEAILRLGTIILERHGYTVLAAQTPSAALALMERYEGRVQLLITDVVMPEMNGKVLREKITALRPGIKALYMSGYTANVIAHHGVLEEGIHFLQKPFSVHTLTTRVRETLDAD